MTAAEALRDLKSLVEALQLPASYNPRYAPTLISRVREELPEIMEALSQGTGTVRTWYCGQCAVEVYDRRCVHCGKTERERR